MPLKAIDTLYKGYRFRSRLEARWAVFFDDLALRWEYEKEGYVLDGNRYLPDFHTNNGWIEIKPKGGIADREETLARLLAVQSKRQVVVFCGDPVDVFGGEVGCHYDYSHIFLADGSESYCDFVRLYLGIGLISLDDPWVITWKEIGSRGDILIEKQKRNLTSTGEIRPGCEEFFNTLHAQILSLHRELKEYDKNVLCPKFLACDELSKRAAQKARSARFEHGEKGI